MAIKFMPKWSTPYTNKIGSLILRNGSTKEARSVLDTAIKKTSYRFQRLRISLDIYDARYNEALIKTELSDPSDFDDQGDILLHYAMIHNYLDHRDLAKTYYDSASVFFVKKLKEDPENATTYIQAGYAYAGLKDRLKAIEAGKKAVKLSTDVLSRNNMLIGLAQIYVITGDYDNGIRQIDELLKNPSDLSTKLLQLDPVWKPIQEKPAFKKILIDHSTN
jgi:tetratricopeptide (TPR) repeat protein